MIHFVYIMQYEMSDILVLCDCMEPCRGVGELRSRHKNAKSRQECERRGKIKVRSQQQHNAARMHLAHSLTHRDLRSTFIFLIRISLLHHFIFLLSLISHLPDVFSQMKANSDRARNFLISLGIFCAEFWSRVSLYWVEGVRARE
jgi:hypothetical protein